MTRENLTSKIKNLSRGGENYRFLRWRVFAALAERPNDALASIPTFLATRFFSLRLPTKGGAIGQPLHALSFTDRDWKILTRLLQDESSARLGDNYLRLAADFILQNAASVSRLLALDSVVSRAALALDTEALLNAFSLLEPVDRQSLFAFKLYGALNSATHKAIADHFAHAPHSAWVRQRLVYPLIYYYLNLPSDGLFEQMLLQIFPDLKKARSERLTVSLLLREDSGHDVPLAFKCYIGLLCHPFDLLGVLANHFERVVALGRSLQPVELGILEELENATGWSRLTNIIRFARRVPISFIPAPTSLPFATEMGLAADETTYFEAFVDAARPEPASPNTGAYEHLRTLRWRPYPTRKDFEATLGMERRYAFCGAGRFLSVAMTSLYMVERKPVASELTHLLRHAHFFGVLSSFSICSPRGAFALESGLFGDSTASIESQVDTTVGSWSQGTDRSWIKAFHWGQRHYERSMRLSPWFANVRRSLRLSGNSRYLSGIDWRWIDDVIAATRLRHFQGNPDAVYVLLIRLMEERQRDPNTLRLAIAPMVPQGRGVKGAVDVLMKEYKRDTLALIRFFLSATTILKMRLEGSYTAALSERLIALETAVDTFGLDDETLTEDQFAQEQRSLTTALTFLSVAAAQFEVPWDAFAIDAADSTADIFRTHLALQITFNDLSLLSNAKKSSLQLFSNRQSQTYQYRNRDWPLVLIISGIVDTFISNPSYGIEAILAIRIRHDNLRREFAVALDPIKKISLPGVTDAERNKCISLMEPRAHAVLQAWIDKYMHTPRAATSTAIFNFVPTQRDIDLFLSQVTPETELIGIVEMVAAWLRHRLEQNLETARDKLSGELKASYMTELRGLQLTLIAEGQVSATAAEKVASAMVSALHRRADELLDWFEAPTAPRTSGLTYAEMKLATDGRFRAELERLELTTSLYAPTLGQMSIAPDAIRLVFDLWSELTMNALKYKNRPKAKIRVFERTMAGMTGLMFSSLSECVPASPRTYVGEPQASPSESMLRKGKSGMTIVAALAAAIARRPVQVRIWQRRHGFHVFVPLVESKANDVGC